MSETKFSPASSKIGWLWQIPYTEILKLEDCRFAAYGFFTGEKKTFPLRSLLFDLVDKT